MSRNKVADAAHITPFPRSLDPQEGQPSASTSENGERGRQSKPKKGKDRPRQERSAHPEEEMRFNVGPRAFRNIAGRGGRRAIRPGRQDSRSNNNDGVPDYPPPSFLEAMSSPPLSVCPSTTTLVPTPSNIPLPFPESISEVMERSPISAASTQLSMRLPLAQMTSESDSEGSLEIIERGSVPTCGDSLPSGPQLEERVKNDWRRRRGVDFPAPSSLHTDLSAIRSPTAADAQSRGRSKQNRGLVDLDPEDSPGDTLPPTPISPKKRHLSLSPLRTLLPARILAFHDRSLSAHPSPGTSPYSASRSTTSFFRSTGSLSTASFLGLPAMFGDSPTPKSEGLARRLFSKGKEKERVREKAESESLDSWEILAPHEQEPHSLMTAVESITDSAFSTNIHSPTRCQSFSGTSPLSSVFSFSRIAALPNIQGDEPSLDIVEDTSKSEYLLARDRIYGIPSSPFINRPVRRAAAISEEDSPVQAHSVASHLSAGPPLTSVRTRMPTGPTLQSSVPPSSLNATSTDPVTPRATVGPPLTSVRMRIPPEPSQLSSASPVSYPKNMAVIEVASSRALDKWKQEEMDSQALFQRALETPLPVTPVSHIDSNYSTEEYSNLPVQYPALAPSPLSGVAAGIGVSRDSRPDRLHDNGELEARMVANDPRHAVYQAKQMNTRPYTPRSAVQISVLELPPASLLPEPMTPTRHHYPGRPLPRPPGPSRTLVDSTYAPHEDFPEEPTTSRSDAHFPEGLLIDLDDTSLSGYSPSGASTPRTADEARFRSQIHLPMPFSMASTSEPSDPGADIAFSPRDVNNRTPSPPLASSQIGLSDMTDLDLLISQLEDGSQSGNDYEALLLVQEFIGPASPNRRTRNSRASSIPEEDLNLTLVGCVQVDRRRVTPDGRVKLKLSLFDIAVDRCGICLSQFKGGELAVLSSICRHTFHDECLGKWLARSKTCPMCRVHLDSDG